MLISTWPEIRMCISFPSCFILNYKLKVSVSRMRPSSNSVLIGKPVHLEPSTSALAHSTKICDLDWLVALDIGSILQTCSIRFRIGNLAGQGNRASYMSEKLVRCGQTFSSITIQSRLTASALMKNFKRTWMSIFVPFGAYFYHIRLSTIAAVLDEKNR